MNIEKTFKSLVIFYALFFCVSTFILWDSSVETFLYGETFTETHLKIFSAFPESYQTASNGVPALFVLGLMIIILITSYRLYKFKSYARELFIIFLLLSYFYSFFLIYFLIENPIHLNFYTEPEDWASTLSKLMEGAILVFMYFTSIKDKFN